MSQVEKVVFYFPWREVSGGPFYLTNLANDLAEDERYEVLYIDYDPGLSDALLQNKRIKKISYSEPFDFPLQEPVTLITPVYCAPHIPELHPQSKIVFLNWHNYCTQELLNIWRLSDAELQHFLRLLCNRNALFFLDRAHWQAQNEWIRPQGTYSFPEQYVPVKINPTMIRAKQELVSASELNIAVLGRLCTDKIFSIINLLEGLEKLSNTGIKNVYVIGSGDEAERITNRNWQNNIQVHMMGTITGDDLRNFLAKKADVLFSMGMSVLEGANIGLPSVIMPHNVQPFSVDEYAYLHESKGYAVGWYDTQISQMGIEMHALASILNDIYEMKVKSVIGQKSLAYVKQNHMSNIEFLKEALELSSLNCREFEQFASKQGKIRICGIPVIKLKLSFDGTQKSVSLFGNDKLIQYRTSPEKKEFVLFGKPCKWITTRKEGNAYCLYVGNIRVPFIKV